MLMIATTALISGKYIRGRNFPWPSENHCSKNMRTDGVSRFPTFFLRLRGGKGSFRTDLLSKRRPKTSKRNDEGNDLVSRDRKHHHFSSSNEMLVASCSSSSGGGISDDGGAAGENHIARDCTTPQSLSEGCHSDEEEEIQTPEEKIERLRLKFQNLEGRRSAQLRNYVSQKRAIQIVTNLNPISEAYVEIGHTYVGMQKGEALRMLNERIILCASEYHKIRKRMELVVKLLQAHDFNINMPSVVSYKPPVVRILIIVMYRVTKNLQILQQDSFWEAK